MVDILDDIVVRGVGGRRDEYRRIQSIISTSAEPAVVAEALIEAFSPSEIYVADLDAIRSSEIAPPIRQAVSHRVPVWMDAGIRDGAGAKRVMESGCQVVAGLESVESSSKLKEILDAVSPENVVFSLDLKSGLPLRTWEGFESPLAIAREALRLGVRRLIVLDLASVGEGRGTGTEELCRQLANEFPKLDLIAGGGVANWGDIRRLAAIGVRGVLVASALHDGRISNSNREPSC